MLLMLLVLLWLFLVAAAAKLLIFVPLLFLCLKSVPVICLL